MRGLFGDQAAGAEHQHRGECPAQHLNWQEDGELRPDRGGDGGILLLSTLFGLFPFLKKLFADGGYQGPQF